MDRSDPRQLLVAIAKILKRLRIPYLVSGGIAVLIWGRPRFTADIDIVVELKSADIPRLTKELQKLGEGYFDEEMMSEAVRTSGEFNFIDGVTGVKVDFWMWRGSDPFDFSRFGRRVGRKILGETVYFTSPEDLILIKLKWHRLSGSSKQLEDVESILKFSKRMLDVQYLKKWADKLGCGETLRSLMKK
ncbi:MAG: hypothetical protein HYW65_04385 [Candidatus Liptonbacteria bacterium]|nr:hypothetical protein [Candidatus Liptonbacteria bacterium]